MRIIERAAESPEFDLDRLEKLLSLKERWDKNEGVKAFAAAKVEFKKHAPDIIKNKFVAYKDIRYAHATHDEVTDKLSEALAAFGFSHAWSMTQSENSITVRCTLTHVGGHSEWAELTSMHDGSGGKNSIQAIASANSYLQRYTLLAVAGASTRDMPNDDGRDADKSTMHTGDPVPVDAWQSLKDAWAIDVDALQAAWFALSNDTRKLITTHRKAEWDKMKATVPLSKAPA
jgi:hypothetical protein